ncbi:MAG: gliding motility-associated C-terminal domain-containing protein [Marinilabilia sp.]
MQARNITLLLLLFVVSFTGRVWSQLTADGAVTAQTSYETTTPDDPVFCFPPDAPMVLRYETGDEDLDFSWFRHDPTDNSWDNALTSGSDQVVVDEIGGYRVVAEDSEGNITEERCWVYNTQGLNNIEAAVDYDDCFSVELSAESDSIPLLFYDPADGSVGGVDYQLAFEWTTIPPGDEQQSGNPVEFDAPYEDMTYVVTVTDRFGHQEEASVDYGAIAVMADFEADVLKDDPEHERHDETQGSAPIEIDFSNESEGPINALEWTFGSPGHSVEQNPRVVFTEEGTDSVTLRVVGDECEDVSDPYIVDVWESELDVPNVFTPNGDGINDEFRVAYRSLKEFEMVIFNRWGRKVYESKDPKKGWDGTVGGKTGSPGVYFYYIRAEGYNEEEVHKEEGAVHLIRDK